MGLMSRRVRETFSPTANSLFTVNAPMSTGCMGLHSYSISEEIPLNSFHNLRSQAGFLWSYQFQT